METKNAQLSKAEELFQEAFKGARDPRSTEYKHGVMAALIHHCAGIKISESRLYKVGTVEFDAFSAGVDEGHSIWRQELSEEKNSAG